MHTAAAPATETLYTACGRTQNPGIACRMVWDVTHSTKAANLTMVYFAGPAQLVIRIAFVVLIALVLRLIAHRAIGRITARATRESGDGGDRTHALLFRERRLQRASALGAILSNAASVTIFGIAAVIIIGDMGLNLAPVLASTAVLGVAIGFGAQNLVQDFLAGIFMLLEDQYGVGDVIDTSEVKGTVEEVGLRITKVRDADGVIWYLRNGAIKRVGNQSQGWARAVVDVPVAYTEDVGKVREIMELTAGELYNDEAWHDRFIDGQPKILGVESLDGAYVIVRLQARTAPLKNFEVARELRARLKAALDSADVQVASLK